MAERSAEKKAATPAVSDISLPLYRIRTIMKSSPEVSTINQESVHLIAKATELFITQLALMAFRASDTDKYVDYSDLAEVVNTKTKLEFLQDIIPRKITGREYLEMLQDEDAEDSESN